METRQQQTKNMIREGMGKFGKDLFNQLYDMLELEIQNDTDPKVRQQLVYDICEGNKELMNLCQKLEEIIYWETQFTYAWKGTTFNNKTESSEFFFHI